MDTIKKSCTKCGNELPLTEFYIESKGKYGRSAVCKSCRAASRGQKRTPRPVYVNDTSRQCKSCNQILPLDEFYKSSEGFMGRRAVCKTCFATQYGWERKQPQVAVPAGMKRCSNCAEIFPLTSEYFHRDKAMPDGFRYICKPCASTVLREYRNNNADRLRISKEDWKKRNPEKVSASRKRYYTRHPDKMKLKRKSYKALRPDVFTAAKQRRRARELNLPDDFTTDDINYLLQYFHGLCAVCKRPLNDLFNTHSLALDHWIPLSHPDCPGTVPSNMIPLCGGKSGCNNSKSNKMPAAWLASKLGDHKANIVLAEIATYFQTVRQVDTSNEY